MSFRIFRRTCPLPPDSGAAQAAEEAALQQSLAQLEARLDRLRMERVALERLASLQPGGIGIEACEAIERELGPRLRGPGWDALKAWFRGQP